jgi:3-oxoacyl-[acyl-carrier protein] reductase
MEINNSRILITGGSSGIGKETAKQFIQKGAQVVITGRDENKLKLVATEIGAIPLLFDISDLNSINGSCCSSPFGRQNRCAHQ